MLMPLSRAVCPALRPCSTTNGRPVPRHPLPTSKGCGLIRKSPKALAASTTSRSSALAYQIEAQVGHVDVRLARQRFATARRDTQSGPERGSSSVVGQRQRQHFRVMRRVRARDSDRAASTRPCVTSPRTIHRIAGRHTNRTPPGASALPNGVRSRSRMRSYGQPGIGMPICEPSR